VARVALAVLCVLVLAGCGGEKTVSPTGPVEGPLPKAAEGNPTAGRMVFLDTGCGGCHAFNAAETNAQVGPDLDEALQGKDAEYVRKAIVDPSAEIAEGYSDLMPKDYGSQLDSQELADLVAFLTQQ